MFNNSNSASNCASNCTNDCANNAQNNAALRVGLFGSIAPLQGNNFGKDKVWLTCGTKCRNTFQIRFQKKMYLFLKKPCHIKKAGRCDL